VKRARRVAVMAMAMALIASCSGGKRSSTPKTSVPAASSAAPSTVPAPLPKTSVALPRVPGDRISPVPTTIAANCSTDVTKQLQAWIDATPDNATLRFGAGACYRLDGTLRVSARHRLVLDGNGATLRAVTKGTLLRVHVQVERGSDITIKRLSVRGASPNAGASRSAYDGRFEGQAGFRISGATRVLLDRVAASDVYGDFVYVGPAGRVPSQDVTVEGSTFARSSRQGMSITAGVNVAFRNNLITDAGLTMFDLEANSRSALIQHVEIMGNVTGAAHTYWFANKGRDAKVGDIRIVGNTMRAPSGGLMFVYGQQLPYRGPFVVENNQFVAGNAVHDEGAKGAFLFAHAQDVTIRNNVVSFVSGMPAVELRDAHHVVVSGNQFRGAGELVLRRNGSTDVHVA
jgi:hypothetical protein